MNKLSIILSMFVAVAVAAVAAITAGPSLTAATDPTQGYWITLSQKQDAPVTSYDREDICYLSVVQNQYYPINTVKEEVPSNTSYWHAEPVANNDQAFYLVDNNRRYLSVSLDKVQESYDKPLVYFYKTAVTTNQAQAAFWAVNPGSGITKITLAGVPASMQATIDAIELPNVAPDNIYLSMSQKNATVHMADASGEYPQWDFATVGLLTTDWTLETAEQRYDAAFNEAEARIQSLFNIPALWNNTQANDRAQQTIETQRTNYAGVRGANARPATAIASMQSAMNQAYTTVYSSVANKVITLTDSSGSLSTDGKTLSYTGGQGLDMLWTLSYSGGGFVIQNQTEGCYIALIPEKQPSVDPYYQPIPGVPAHFGVASQPTVFSFVPDNGGITLYAGEQPFYLTDFANGEKLDSDHAAELFTPAEMTAQDVQNIVLADPASQFAGEKLKAEGFLQTLSHLANTPEDNVYDFAAENLQNLTGTITIGPNTTAMQVLAEAKRQLGMIASVVNEASLTPALIQSTVGSTTKYLSASSASRQVYDEYGNLVTVNVPDARMTGLDATSRGHRLSTALWAFEYVSDGQFRLLNSEGLYLSAPHYDSEAQENVNATSDADEATLFILNNGQFEYTDGVNPAVISMTSGGNTFDTFAMGNPTAMPNTTESTTNAEDVVIPSAPVSYYQIASIGGGGVITGVLPGDDLTHSSSSIGSYWWIEIDNNDPINNNAFIIHSIYPGYYLGADLRLSDTPCTWYLNENGIQASTSGNVNNVFNGYNAGLVISTTPANNRGNVIAAAPYTTAGDPNPALQNGRFAAASWQLQSWMFVEAQSASTIVTDYVNNNLSWQLRAVEDGLNNISGMSPFGSNALSLANSLLDEFKSTIGYTTGGSISITNEDAALQAILDFNNIMARVQTEFDQEVIEDAPGKTVKIVNEGRSFADYSANIFLAGAGSNLAFVDFADNTPASEWHIAANSTRGITFANGNRQSLGAPNANGTITGSTGTYRLTLDIWWDILEESNGNYYSTGATAPWYAVPEALISASPSSQEDYYNMSVKSGLGMENVMVPGIGLAARGGESDLLCGSDLNNIYSQWSFRIHNPAPSGIEEIGGADSAAEEVALFNLQGQRVDRANAAAGIYLSRRADGSVVKVTIK